MVVHYAEVEIGYKSLTFKLKFCDLGSARKYWSYNQWILTLTKIVIFNIIDRAEELMKMIRKLSNNKELSIDISGNYLYKAVMFFSCDLYMMLHDVTLVD